MRRLLLMLHAMVMAIAALAQDAVLRGTVVDAASREPVIGANVTYAPGKGGATGPDGRFSFPIPAGIHEIGVSFIGYNTTRLPVTLAPGEEREIAVSLAMSATQLDMVVVTAGRFEQRVGEVTQSLSVLRPDIVLNKNIVSMEDALDQVPGVIIVDGEPQIRAGSGFSYGAGSRVQVLIDDIPILSGDIGRPNWTFLPIENLEQVEVIKGAASVLHGSAALGGVINVRTAYPRSEPRTRVTMFTGMYDRPQRAEARWWGENNPMISGTNFFHSRQIGNLDLVLGGNAFADAGYIGPEPVSPALLAADPLRVGPAGYDNRIRFNTGLRWRDRRVRGLNYGVNANVMKSRSTAILIWEDIEAGLYRPKQGTVTRTLGSQFYVDPFINYHSKQGTRHSLRVRLHHQDFENDNDQSNSNQVLHGEYQVQQTVDLLGPAVVTAGIVYRHTASQALLYSGDADNDGINAALNTAGYVQVDKRLFDRISLSGGMRYERFAVNEDVAEQPVFRAGATYQVLKATFLRVSYGQGFRFPTIGERFINTSVGMLRIYPNHELRPETSTNIEGGIKQGFRIGGFHGYLDAVVFLQEYQDMVEFTFGQWRVGEALQIVNGQLVGDPGLGFMSVNTGGGRVTGTEFELAGQGGIGRSTISVLTGYTYTLPVSTTPDQVYGQSAASNVQYTYLNTSLDTTGNILKFRVQHLFRADVQWEYGRIFAGGSVRYNSHVRNIDRIFSDLDMSTNPFFQLRTGVTEWMRTHRTGDTVFDGRFGARLTDQVRLTFIVNNMLNREYAIRPLAIEAPRNFQLQLMVDI